MLGFARYTIAATFLALTSRCTIDPWTDGPWGRGQPVDWHGPALLTAIILTAALLGFVGRKRFRSYVKAVETGDTSLLRDQYQMSTVLFLLKCPEHYVGVLRRIERPSNQSDDTLKEANALILGSLIRPKDVLKASALPGPSSRHSHEFLRVGEECLTKIRSLRNETPAKSTVDPSKAVCLLCVVGIADYWSVPQSTSPHAVIDAFRELTDQPQKENTLLRLVCFPDTGGFSELEGRDLFQRVTDVCKS